MREVINFLGKIKDESLPSQMVCFILSIATYCLVNVFVKGIIEK